jgi:hypothetical protein
MNSGYEKLFGVTVRPAVMVVKLFLALLVFPGSNPSATASVPARLTGPIYADYDSELRESIARSDGIKHVDTPALIQKLSAGNIKTYAFLVHHQTTDWDDFRLEFLPAAQAAHIEVWLYLTPPSEISPEPYTTNYIAWATAAASLAQTYPVLKALAIDDFNGNENLFTPSYVSNMVVAALAINTNLVFLPVNYDFSHNGITSYLTNDICPAFAKAYGPFCGGVIFPYLNWTNKSDYSDELFQISNNAAIMRGEVCQFLVSFPSSTRSQVGDFSALVQTITNAAGFPNAPYPFPIRVFDDYNGATAGYHQLQVLVDGAVAWERDVSGTNGVQDISLNLQSQLSGKTSAALTVRVYDAKAVSNFHVLAGINLPAGNWTKMESGSFTGNGIYFSGTPGLNVPLITMIYDGGYGSGTNYWGPTTNYVLQANLLAHTAMLNHVAAGIIQYKMDKTTSSGQFPIVQQLYGRWAYYPQFTSINRQPDGSVTVNGTGGGPNISYTLQSADNVIAPSASWSSAATNHFDLSGNFTNTGLNTSGKPVQFFRISVP